MEEYHILMQDGKAIRSYVSYTRADEDLVLLQDLFPDHKYEIVVIQHIDD